MHKTDDSFTDIYDCLYIDSIPAAKIEKIIVDLKKAFDNVKLEGISDGIHGTRLSVSLKNDRKKYYKEVIKMGLGNVSFNLGLLIATGDGLVKELVEELKREKSPKYLNKEEN